MKRREGGYGLDCWDFVDEGMGDFQGRANREVGRVDGVVVEGMKDRMGIVGNDNSLDVGGRMDIDGGVVRKGEVVVVVVEVGGRDIEGEGRRNCYRRGQSLGTCWRGQGRGDNGDRIGKG